MYALVLVEIGVKNVDKYFTYHIPDNLEDKINIGIRVKVPFNTREISGFVIKIINEIEDNNYEVKDILEIRQDIDFVQDISNSINQENIMVFDCKLSESIFSKEIAKQLIEESAGEIDESFFDLFFEDVKAFLKDTTDEIEEELQEIYLVDNIRCCFDIYSINDDFTDFKFVFIASFKETRIAVLENLAKIVSKRQLVGASKFYC